MIITLSEARNEYLVCEWSGEITDEHAQDFCDVCNTVFSAHFDLDYMHRKYYNPNIYGKNFIIVVYREGQPVSSWGGWRNDLYGRTAFQMCDFASIPSARKGGYIVDMQYCTNDEIGKYYPDAIIYGFPGENSYPIAKATGQLINDFYAKRYLWRNEDFIKSVPLVEDDYVNAFLLNKKDLYITKLNGRYYFVIKTLSRRIIPSGFIIAEVSSKFKDNFPRAGRFRVYKYYSLNPTKRSINYPNHTAKYALRNMEQIVDIIPPLYKADTRTFDFNGTNDH